PRSFLMARTGASPTAQVLGGRKLFPIGPALRQPSDLLLEHGDLALKIVDSVPLLAPEKAVRVADFAFQRRYQFGLLALPSSARQSRDASRLGFSLDEALPHGPAGDAQDVADPVAPFEVG